ncbi:MAG: hypothetical protein JXA04_11530 [Gammaproteobacteria bacterium]|nr:hypothetical protein [Gammaproteobacteria bacterium]
MKQKSTLLAVLTLSTLMLFGIGSAGARSSEIGMSKKNAVVVKVARTERGESNRRDNRRHDNSRPQQNKKPAHEPRRQIPHADRNHDRDRRHAPVPNQRYRDADRKSHHREAYRGSQPQHHPRYFKAQPGYWVDYHRGYKHDYRHRYYHGHHYYYNQLGFYFPGFGFIAHGHIHNRHCPHWHFEPFAAGLILGAILSN